MEEIKKSGGKWETEGKNTECNVFWVTRTVLEIILAVIFEHLLYKHYLTYINIHSLIKFSESFCNIIVLFFKGGKGSKS